jgi:hypothetical protein
MAVIFTLGPVFSIYFSRRTSRVKPTVRGIEPVV